MSFELTYTNFGADALLIEWPKRINSSISKDIHSLNEKVLKECTFEVYESIPAYQSLTLFLHKRAIMEDFIVKVKKLYAIDRVTVEKRAVLWKIPVCYDIDFGWDIDAIARSKEISISEVIQIHTKPIYCISFLGFLPGFPYLEGLDTRLAVPRLSSPRTFIPKGSVAIGGSQTGVYTMESPGGWSIVGNTPVSLFSSEKDPPCFMKPGDRVQFFAISEKLHEKIMTEQEAGSYQIEKEVFHD